MAYELPELIADIREQAGLTQADLATAVGVRQQTVSRWEAGRSRPDAQTAHRLSDVLGVEHRGEILRLASRTADQGRPLTPVRPLLKRLPLDKLSPTDFEGFCRDLIALRHPNAEVHRFGDQGHTQHGVDLIARVPDGTTTSYQCKRVQQFGPARVRAAVAAATFPAQRHCFLLSRTASPDARREVANHRDWTLEDAEDISRAVRFDLPPDDARRLIDTYFPGWRADFLGVDRPGIWLNSTEFFRPMLKPTSILSHGWELVGRAEELNAVDKFISSQARALVVSARGGAGKSRFMRAIAALVESSGSVAARFLAPESAFLPHEIEGLPDGPVVVMVDDAHDRDDMNLLLASLARSHRDVKLVLATRPYGKDRLMAELRAQGMATVEDESALDLPDLDQSDVQLLAAAVLHARGGPSDAAEPIAWATRDCPLFTVIAANLVAAGRADPRQLLTDEVTRSFLLRSFRDAIVGSLGDPAEEAGLQETLRLVALVQPVITSSEEFPGVAKALLGPRTDRAMRHVRILEEAGVLLRRGRKLRVMPDLLGEFLVADSCVEPRTGEPTGYAELVFAAATGDLAQNVILNLARLDWRISREQHSDARVLDNVWQSLTRSMLSMGIFGRHALLKALSNVSYFQPARAIRLVQAILETPTDEIDVDRRLLPKGSYTHDHVLDSIPGFLRGAAYHIDFVAEVCDILWRLGRDRPGLLHSQPDHALRVVQDLVSIKPGKPLEFSACIVDRAIAWTRDPELPTYKHSPFDVLEAVLATEGYETESRGWTVHMKPFAVRPEAVRPLRDRAVNAALDLLDHDDVRVGVRASRLLEHALRSPSGVLGRVPTAEEHDSWRPEFLSVLHRLADRVRDANLDPVVEDRLRGAVRWHTNREDGCADAASSVLGHLDGGLATRVTRALAHGWAYSSELAEHDELDYAELEKRWRERQLQIAEELVDELDPVDAANLLEDRLGALMNADEEIQSAPGPFLACVCEASEAVASEILRRTLSQPDAPFIAFAQIVATELRKHHPKNGAAIARQLIETANASLAAQAAATLAEAAQSTAVSADELALMTQLTVHDSVLVRMRLARGLRFASALDKPARLATLLSIAIDGATAVADEVLGNFGRHGDFDISDLSEQQVDRLLDDLVECDDIGKYQLSEFLSTVSSRYHDALLSLFQRRIDRPDDPTDDHRYQPIPFRWDDGSPLQFRDTPGFGPIVERICDWMLEPDDGWRRGFWSPHLFAAVVGRIDDTVLEVLSAWAGMGDPRRLEVVSHLFREAPRNLVWTRVDWVRELLEQAADLDNDCYSRVASGLHSAVVSGTRSGKPGEPFPEDIEQRDRSNEVAATLPVGTPAHRFYMNLVKSAEASIRWSIERDEEGWPE